MRLQTPRHTFPDMREALDAVNALEAVTPQTLDYHLEYGPGGVAVTVRQASGMPTAFNRQLLGYLAP